MEKQKPAPGGNREAGYGKALECGNHSLYSPSLSACNFRHIGDAVSKIIEQLAAQLCEVRHE